MPWDSGRIRTFDELTALYGPVHPVAAASHIDHVDEGCRSFIAASSFMLMGTMGADGTGDVSPKGGPPGFVRVLDDEHLTFGDRPGNNRLDSLRNLFERPGVGLLFLIPGYDVSILRVNGEGFITAEQAVRDLCAVDGETPTTAIVVSVHEAFVHCTKSLYRGAMWDPSRWPDTTDVASISDMVRHHMELVSTKEPPS